MAQSLAEDRRCQTRLARLLEHITADRVEVIADADLPTLLADVGEREALERGGLGQRHEAKALVALRTGVGGEIFPGYGWRELRRGRHERVANRVLCHTAVEIQSAVGCPFDCTYCPYTRFIAARLDVEAFADQVVELARARRSQTLFKLNNRTDTLGLEPAYGLAPVLVERFAGLPGKYLMLYAKGAAVEDLVDLDHRGKTVACFTLTPPSVAALLEPGAPPPAERLAAIARLAAAGYPIRVRFSPIVPLRGWRDAYARLVTQLAAVAEPEMVTLWTLSMIELPELYRIVPEAALDAEALAASRAAAETMRGRKGAPFPPTLRSEIYRTLAAEVRLRLPSAAVALCLESAPVWDATADLVVPRHHGRFACNCGPRVTPGAVAELRDADGCD